MIVQSYRGVILLIFCVTFSSLFSMNKVVSQLGYKMAGNLAIAGAQCAWIRVKALRGIDVDSIAETSRLAETASEQLLPRYIYDPAHLAPETVPHIMQQRVECLNRGDYSWPTCKPILLVGPPGTGKTELAKYSANKAQCPFVCESASSLYGGRRNLATELIRSLFKRARYRSLTTICVNFFKSFASLISLHGWAARKPSIIHLEEFNGLALATRPVALPSEDQPLDRPSTTSSTSFFKKIVSLVTLHGWPASRPSIAPAQPSGDQVLERERVYAFNRFIWELNRNPHNANMPTELRDWSKDLPPNHIMHHLLEIEPHLATVIPNYSCPPATPDEKILTFSVYKLIVRTWICSYLRRHKKQVQEKEIAQLLTDDSIIPIIWAYQHNKRSSWSFSMWFLLQICRFNNWLAANDPTDALVIATTNADKDHLDPRIKRLFDIIEVRQPDEVERRHILDFHAPGKLFDGIDFTVLARKLEGFSPDRIAHVIRYAVLHAAASGRTHILNADIDYAYTKLSS